MDLGLARRRAFVTASSSGLGRAVAAGLASEGARVAVHGRDENRLAEVAAQLGAEAAVRADLSTEGEAARAVEVAAEALGGLDIVVVNTGGGRPGGILETSARDEEAAYASMLAPALAVGRAAAPLVRSSGSGSIVFLTARSVLETTPELALSSVFRSGVAAAARSLAVELAPSARVNVVVPGQFDTPAYERFEGWRAQHGGTAIDEIRTEHLDAIPLGRLGRADELADVVVFLSSERASYVTGAVIRVDGGSVRGF